MSLADSKRFEQQMPEREKGQDGAGRDFVRSPPARSRIHLKGRREYIPPSSKPLVEEEIYDRSSTKSERNIPRSPKPLVKDVIRDHSPTKPERQGSLRGERVPNFNSPGPRKDFPTSLSYSPEVPSFEKTRSSSSRTRGELPSPSCLHRGTAQLPKLQVTVMIQIEPGVNAPLRGGEETWEALIHDFYMPGLCMACDTTIFVIQDAGYVLCPDCRTVSPMEGEFVDRISAGVGLGFKYDDLMRWQTEILEERKKKMTTRGHSH